MRREIFEGSLRHAYPIRVRHFSSNRHALKKISLCSMDTQAKKAVVTMKCVVSDERGGMMKGGREEVFTEMKRKIVDIRKRNG